MSSVSIVELREVSGSLKDDLSYIRDFLTKAREDFDDVKSQYNDIMSYQDKELEGERVVKKRDETSSGGEVIHKEITTKTYVHFSPGTDFNSYFNRLNSYCVAAERDLKKLEQQVQKIDDSANDIEGNEKEIVAALMAIEKSKVLNEEKPITSIGALKEDDNRKLKEYEDSKEPPITSIGALKEDDNRKLKEYEDSKEPPITSIGALKEDDNRKLKEYEDSKEPPITSIGALKEDDNRKLKEYEDSKEPPITSIGALKEDDNRKLKEYKEKTEKKEKETKEDVSGDTGSDGNDYGSSSGHDSSSGGHSSSSRSGGSSGKSSKSHESSKKESVGLKFISNTQKDIDNENTVEGVALSDIKKSYSEIKDDENLKIVSDIPDNEKFVTETEKFEKLANKALDSVKNDLSQDKNIDTTTSTGSSDSQISNSSVSSDSQISNSSVSSDSESVSVITQSSNSESVPVITQSSNVLESPSNNDVDMMEDIYSAPVYESPSNNDVDMMEDIYSTPVYESIPNTGIGDKEISTNYSIPVIAGVIGGAGIGLGLREKMKDDDEKKKSTIEENNN